MGHAQDLESTPVSGSSSPAGARGWPLTPGSASAGQSAAAGGGSEGSRLFRCAGRDTDVIEQWEIVQDGSNLFNFEGSAALTSRLHPATHAQLSPDDVAIWQSAPPMLIMPACHASRPVAAGLHTCRLSGVLHLRTYIFVAQCKWAASCSTWSFVDALHVAIRSRRNLP